MCEWPAVSEFQCWEPSKIGSTPINPGPMTIASLGRIRAANRAALSLNAGRR